MFVLVITLFMVIPFHHLSDCDLYAAHHGAWWGDRTISQDKTRSSFLNEGLHFFQFFWKKRTFCLPLPAVYIPETDKYSCLHSNRWEKMPTCCTNCHKLLQRIVVLETKLFAGLPKQTEHTADGHHGPPQHTASESCESSESQQFIPSVEEQAETDRRTNQWHKQGARPKGSRDTRLSRVSRIAAVASSTPDTAMTRLVSTGILQPPIHLENRFEALMNMDEESQNMTKLGSNQPAANIATNRRSRSSRQRHSAQSAAEPRTLIVGDSIIRNVRTRTATTCCFPQATVSDVNKELRSIVMNHKTANRVIIHVGKNDIRIGQSELLKQDFSELFETLQRLEVVIKDVALSDHFCIFFDILISVTTESRSVSVRKRCINENTSVLFMKAISLTPSISADSVDFLLDSFDSKVKNVIDDIAPIKVSKKNGRQKSFWRKSTAVQNMKRQCRKAERMWRKTKLEIHYSIYKDSLHAFNLELATARQTFFSNLINSNLNNTRTLFATVERLTNPPSQIPSEMLSDSKCNEFASFFSEKISNIRKEIGTSSCNTEVTQIRQQSQKEVTMSVFKTIDSKILEEIVQHLKSSTCYLDTLPTSFFKSVLNCLEADLLEVVNTSLLSGTFPNSLKTAVVKPPSEKAQSW